MAPYIIAAALSLPHHAEKLPADSLVHLARTGVETR